MAIKFPLGLLFAVSFVFSCNTNQEEKNDNLPKQASSTLAEMQKPSVDFSVLEKKLELDPQNIELRISLASNYYAAKELDKAEYHFLKVYALDKKNIPALNSLGNIYYDSQENDKAIEFYEKTLEIDKMNINVRCDLAVCYSRINKIKKAVAILKENIKIDSRHEKSHYNLSVLLKRIGKLKEADEEMKIYNTLTSSTK